MWSDNPSSIDMLFYKPYADIIAEVIATKNTDPLTIGVFGLWGAGKSTTLKLIQQTLPNDGDNLVCNINAWMFEGYEDAKASIIETLLHELEKSKKFDEKIIDKLFSKANFMKIAPGLIEHGIPLVASLMTGNPLPIALNVISEPGKVADAAKSVVHMFKSSDNEEKDRENSLVNNIRTFKSDFEKLLTEGNKNLVVLIDDLDRCSPERIIEILESIKLFLSVENTTFIIAADEEVIRYAISKRYPKMNDESGVDLSREYIEKIIQLPIYISDLSRKDIENYLLLLVAQAYIKEEYFKEIVQKIIEQKLLLKEEKIEIEKFMKFVPKDIVKYKSEQDKVDFDKDIEIVNGIRSIVASTLKGNPRQTKRFLNTFMTKKKLAKIYYGDDFDIKILAKILVLHKLNPDLFRELNEWNKDYTTINEEYKNMYDTVVKEDANYQESQNDEYLPWKTKEIKAWVCCEPKELYKYQLDKYFYLTRENLGRTFYDESSLSTNARKFLALIGQSDVNNIEKNLEMSSQLTPEEIESVFKVLRSQIKKAKLPFYIISALFKRFTDYQENIFNCILESKLKISLPDTVYLVRMYVISGKRESIKSILEQMKNNEMITSKVLSKVLR